MRGERLIVNNMGMFDYVYWNCKDCGNRNEDQTKAGNCSLSSYDLLDAPFKIQVEFDGEDLYCEKCKSRNTFKIHRNAGFE